MNTLFLVSSDGIDESCILHGNILRFSLDIDADPFSVRSVIPNEAILNPVAVATTKLSRCFTKQNPHLAIIFNRAPSDHVVRITMPNTDAVPFVS